MHHLKPFASLSISDKNTMVKYTLIAITTSDAIQKNASHFLPNAKSPMIRGLQLKKSSGNTANGSCTDCCTLSHSSNVSNNPWLSPADIATTNEGPNAQHRVNSVLFHGDQLISRNPAIAYCPANVPVIVDACPAANSPTPQIYFAYSPNLSPSTVPALFNPISTSSYSGLLWKPLANTATMNKLMKNETNRLIPASMVK
mmetsp:Transcript_1402/g.2212  ORF Transcript_1402/g.2212 Transcript_1402/m.2212 type:complete len:200 (+) Transcript_1402:361-960(+)